jgi:hypothetical protein
MPASATCALSMAYPVVSGGGSRSSSFFLGGERGDRGRLPSPGRIARGGESGALDSQWPASEVVTGERPLLVDDVEPEAPPELKGSTDEGYRSREPGPRSDPAAHCGSFIQAPGGSGRETEAGIASVAAGHRGPATNLRPWTREACDTGSAPYTLTHPRGACAAPALNTLARPLLHRFHLLLRLKLDLV